MFHDTYEVLTAISGSYNTKSTISNWLILTEEFASVRLKTVGHGVSCSRKYKKQHYKCFFGRWSISLYTNFSFLFQKVVFPLKSRFMLKEKIVFLRF